MPLSQRLHVSCHYPSESGILGENQRETHMVSPIRSYQIIIAAGQFYTLFTDAIGGQSIENTSYIQLRRRRVWRTKASDGAWRHGSTRHVSLAVLDIRHAASGVRSGTPLAISPVNEPGCYDLPRHVNEPLSKKDDSSTCCLLLNNKKSSKSFFLSCCFIDLTTTLRIEYFSQ